MKIPQINDVLNVIDEYPEAKEAIYKLFPDCKNKDRSVDVSGLRLNGKTHSIFKKSTLSKFDLPNDLMEIRDSGKYEGKAFFLCLEYDWALFTDDCGIVILVPTKKRY